MNPQAVDNLRHLNDDNDAKEPAERPASAVMSVILALR
jgi:hypothetical protein